jgi:RNA polymerase sigma factor (TIGR02999 family)
MDIHDLPGVTPEAVANAHLEDMRVQSKYGVTYHKYWINQEKGKIYCLCDAPTAEAADAVHREAHGLGLNTNATLLYGHIEARADRLVHMDMLRRAQDEALARLGYGGEESAERSFIIQIWAQFTYSFYVSDVTRILTRVHQGDSKAAEELLPLVYDELRKLAAHRMAGEAAGQTLQPTALVHEAYLKLVDQRNAKWQNRAQFFGISAQLMRRILVDHARQHQAEKRGGVDQQRLSITSAEGLMKQSEVDLLALNEALDELAKMDPQQGRIVELKFFGGLSIEETAEVLGIGHATVERDWKMARAWLRKQLE